jgi:hypothetical protein
MAKPKTNTGLPAQQAIRKGELILGQLEMEGADFVVVDETHAYLWHNEQLVNLYDHQHLLDFLARLGYLKPRTDNKMIIIAALMIEARRRCA